MGMFLRWWRCERWFVAKQGETQRHKDTEENYGVFLRFYPKNPIFCTSNPCFLSYKPSVLKKNTNFLLQINIYYLTLQQFH